MFTSVKKYYEKQYNEILDPVIQSLNDLFNFIYNECEQFVIGNENIDNVQRLFHKSRLWLHREMQEYAFIRICFVKA